MKRQRYLAILPGCASDYVYWRERSRHWAPDRRLIDSPDLIVIGDLPAYQIAGGSPGIVLGELFRSDDFAPVPHLHDTEPLALSAGSDADLFRRFWGSYVAFLRHDSGVSVLRSPFAELPAYTWQSQFGMVVTSDVNTLVEMADYRPSIDWHGIAEHLLTPDILRPRTCLGDVRELQGGTSGHWKEAMWRVSERWSPWNARSRLPSNISAKEAGVYLEPIIRHAVLARAAFSTRPLILLSGGLDSSIVAACLADSGKQLQALTMVTRDAGGDERRYARAVTDAFGMRLSAVRRETASVDICKSLSHDTPRPTEQSFAQATHRAIESLGDEIDAVFHGGGGDNIFCSLQSAAPAADRLLTSGPDRQFWETARGIATLAQVGMPRVAQKALGRAISRKRAYRMRTDISFLSQRAIHLSGGSAQHPWLNKPKSGLPGTAAHIGLTIAAQAVAESRNPYAAPRWVGSLISQPIVEACLSIQSWVWFERGHNRAPARYAFSRTLPEHVAWRRSKGAMSSFIVELFEANRVSLADHLLNGRLAENEMIDRKAIKDILDNPSVTRGEDYGRVMRLADVESWIRSWDD